MTTDSPKRHRRGGQGPGAATNRGVSSRTKSDVRERPLNIDLSALGADNFPHVSGTLGGHLERTETWLRRFGSREALCRAGRHHAIYGTAGIGGSLLPLTVRRTVAAIIGAEAEAIVYGFGACDRDRFHPRIGTPDETLFADRFDGRDHAISHPVLRDFCELTIANELELVTSSPTFLRKHRDDLRVLASRMRAHVSDAAYAAIRDALR